MQIAAPKYLCPAKERLLQQKKLARLEAFQLAKSATTIIEEMCFRTRHRHITNEIVAEFGREWL